MRMPSREEVEAVKNEYHKGDRVMLMWMEDDHAPDVGTLGTVECVDDTGTIHVAWDNWSRLGVVLGEDSCWKLPVCPRCGKAYAARPALSRKDNETPICPDCGVEEALEDFMKQF